MKEGEAVSDQTCYGCGHSRIETHTGDSQLVCWKDKACGVPVLPDKTCPRWADPAQEPIGEYADALIRRIHDLERELAALNAWNFEKLGELASAKATAKHAFEAARSMYRMVPEDLMSVECAHRLNSVYDELVDLGVEVD
ncbi:MAG: hypothetical protein IJ087_01595 [Eggerthellaceae bacterium]|nr:hypothetical protein [Eggerthellaceae bacterium]